MIFREIQHGSAAYIAACDLRDRVLRLPLGLALKPEDIASEKGHHHYGLFENEQLVACVIATPHDAVTAKIRQMAVEPSRQRGGWGRALIGAMEDDLVRKGFRHLFMHARISAMGFYQKLGYAPTGSEFLEVGLPHVKMKKTLPA